MWGNTLLKIYISIDKPCNFIKKAPTRAYFRHLLCPVPAQNPLFQFLPEFSHSRNLEMVCCLGGWERGGGICSFLFIPHTCLAFLKYTLPRQAFSGELCKVFSNTKNYKQVLPKKLFLTYVLSVKGSYIY